MMRILPILLSIIALLYVSCNSARQQKTQGDSGGHFSDSMIVQIHEFKDRRNAGKLIALLRADSASYRKEAALALISVADTAAITPLIKAYLNEKDPVVQKMQLAALSQCGTERMRKALPVLLSKALDGEVKNQAMELIGKFGPSFQDQFIIRETNYARDNPILREGQMRAFYQFCLRNYCSAQMLNMGITYMKKGQPDNVRIWASHFMARAATLKSTDISPHYNDLLHIVRSEGSPEIAANALICIGYHPELKQAQIGSELAKLLDEQLDYRVKVTLMRILHEDHYDYVKDGVIELLDSDNHHLQFMAAGYLRFKGNEEDGPFYYSLAKQTDYWRTKLALLAAAGRQSKDDRLELVLEQIFEAVESSDNPYARNEYYKMLSEYAPNYEFVLKRYKIEDNRIAKAGALEALGLMGTSFLMDSFALDRSKRIGGESPREHIIGILKEAAQSNDPHFAFIAAKWLRQKEYVYAVGPDDVQWVKNARDKWQMPRHYETIMELERLRLYCTGNAYENHRPEMPYNHPIDWDYVKKLSEKPVLNIKTKYGSIRVELNKREAPGTVAYIAKLAEDGFYDKKNFHRVVSNFVIQGGDPIGDGMGATDKSLRTELGLSNFETGSIGMASAGKDTESCQFFITHISTPNLNGRYTVFGKVIEGMEVVHQIEIGDKIEKAWIEN